MIKLIKKLFEKKPSIIINDPDFGDLIYIEVKNNPSNNYWEMNEPITLSDEPIKFMSIPGDESGPYEYARKTILDKCSNTPLLWKCCQEEIEKQIECWYPEKVGLPVKNIFELAAFNVDNENEWEVCFEAKPEYKWVYLSYQFKGNDLVSGTVDT